MTVPSCSNVLFPWISSSLRNSWPSFSRPWDFGSRRRLISFRRVAFSYSLTWSFTCEIASLISANPCTRDLYSSVSAETWSILNRPVFTYTAGISVTKECSQWDYINVEMQILPSVFCMSRSTRMGYFVMRWVTNIKHSGIPNLRTRASWPIFCYKREVLFSKTCIIPAILLSAVNGG